MLECAGGRGSAVEVGRRRTASKVLLGRGYEVLGGGFELSWSWST